MARVKPPKDVINKHVESALISAIRLRRYWISQGNSEDEAIKKAIKQATECYPLQAFHLKNY
ncbi:MAG: hypothetical protein QXL51_05360 [Candidatus Aenigmatarchaeota archaeon]